MKKVAVVVFLAGAAVLFLVYWLSPAKQGTLAQPSPTTEALSLPLITIQNFRFGDKPLRVKAGTSITVSNKDSMAHDVTAKDGSFTTGSIQQNGTAMFTAPKKLGTYEFFCSIHPNMKGTLIVE